MELARDYVQRAQHRLAALEVLHERESWADVVRESQEIVELALKALLRSAGVEPPRAHDVSAVLEAERERYAAPVQERLAELSAVSRELRRDRELAFYGAHDLTPTSFYTRDDAERARRGARMVTEVVASEVLGAGDG